MAHTSIYKDAQGTIKYAFSCYQEHLDTYVLKTCTVLALGSYNRAPMGAS